MSEQTLATPSPTPSPDQLMAKPALSFSEFLELLLGIPKRTAEDITRAGEGPKFFLIGRRRYVRTADAREWVEHQVKARPYFPRRNNRRSVEGADDEC